MCSPFCFLSLALSLNLSVFVGDRPSLDLLWFGTGPEVSTLRLTSFLSVFDCQELSELYGAVDDSLLAALCLVTYLVLQVVITFCFVFDRNKVIRQLLINDFSTTVK